MGQTLVQAVGNSDRNAIRISVNRVGRSAQLATRFSLLHPAVMLLFFAGVILLTLLSYHPAILGLSAGLAILNICLYMGIARLWQLLQWVIPMALVVILFNMLFNHRGATELLSIGQWTFTLESLFFGASIALMLTAIMFWFRLYSQFMTSDRFLYLFAPIVPTIALSVAMVQRWIPLTKQRFVQIRNAQKMLNPKARGVRPLTQALSSLMSWSMEDAIQTADSMQARGYSGRYGDRYEGKYENGDDTKSAVRRSSFRSYHLTMRDICMLIAFGMLIVMGTASLFITTREFGFFPVVYGTEQLSGIALFAAAVLMSFPLVLEGGQQLRWMQSVRKA